MNLHELFENKTVMPMPSSPLYTSEWGPHNKIEMGNVVHKIESNGITPILKTIPLNKIFATQDWLDFEGGGGGDPVFPEYEDYIVVLQNKDGYHLIDGHHRTAKAIIKGKGTIPAYVFTL